MVAFFIAVVNSEVQCFLPSSSSESLIHVDNALHIAFTCHFYTPWSAVAFALIICGAGPQCIIRRMSV